MSERPNGLFATSQKRTTLAKGPTLRSKRQMSSAFHAPREHTMISTIFETEWSPESQGTPRSLRPRCQTAACDRAISFRSMVCSYYTWRIPGIGYRRSCAKPRGLTEPLTNKIDIQRVRTCYYLNCFSNPLLVSGSPGLLPWPMSARI